MKKILMIIASENFRDIEYIVPRAFFEQQGFEVRTASSAKESTGRFGFKIQNDFLVGEVSADDFDGIYMVGGNGSLEYTHNDKARDLFVNFLDQKKAVGAICAAPRNFLHWGLLQGLKSTGHNGDGQFVPLAQEKGSLPSADQAVVVDGGILTANGPEAAEESALEFVELLNK